MPDPVNDARDTLLPFLFEDRALRGAIVSVDSGIGEMFDASGYPAPVRELLSHAAVAMPLLASHLKQPGQINLQFQGGAQLPLLVAQADRELNLRAMAKCEGDTPDAFAELLAGGQMAVLLEPEQGQRHQALVEISGDKLSESLEGYFRQSEQLPTRLVLAAGTDRLAGLLVQQMPSIDAGDDWAHVSALVDTLGTDELLDEPPVTILRRLFHADPVRVLPPRPVALGCNCSHAGISRLLIGMGREELTPVLEERGQVEVTCEFCGSEYVYTTAEVEALIAGSEAEPGGEPTH